MTLGGKAAGLDADRDAPRPPAITAVVPPPREESLEALAAHLLASGQLSAAALERARQLARESGERLPVVLTRLGFLGERALAEALAAVLGLPLAREADFPEAPLMEARLSPRFLREARLLPLAEAPEGLAVALADPLDEAAVAALRFATGRPLLLHVAYPAELEAALERLYGDGRSEISRIVEAAGGRMGEGRAKGRTRPPPRLRAAVVSRVKLMAGLDIAERRLAQDGRLRFTVRGKDIDFRVSTTPTIHGESLVLRILDRGELPLDFAALGFDAPLLEAWGQVLKRPHGMTVVTRNHRDFEGSSVVLPNPWDAAGG